MKKTVARLQEFSIPLILGVVAALFAANLAPEAYHSVVHDPIHEWGTDHSDSASTVAHHDADWAHFLTLHFLVNDLFMVLFFGIAVKEITEACLPNGALSPLSKAINPMFATIGGVVGPIGLFLLLNSVVGIPAWTSGWGVPTATDIALAWLVARFLFGKHHPAVSFLLLLAVADDAIGLGIIAIGYPDPHHPTLWQNVLWVIPGMGIAYILRRMQVHSWLPYVGLGGALCWWGLHSAHLHPALALMFIVPFLPGPQRDLGLFEDPADLDTSNAGHHGSGHSCLERFEHDVKGVVDFGLFFFAFANAGVAFSEINGLTWIMLTSLIFGKMLGITSCSWLACRLGFSLPAGMTMRHVIVTSIIAGLGLTVALFVSGEAFTDPILQGAAKMGAVFSVAAGFLAFVAKWAIGLPADSLPADSTSVPAASGEISEIELVVAALSENSDWETTTPDQPEPDLVLVAEYDA